MIGDITEPIKFKITDVVKDMSNEDYHSHGSEIISSSFVKSVMKNGSVGHALKPFEGDEEALKFGTAFHDYMEINDTDKFLEKYFILDESEIIAKAYAKRKGKETKVVKLTSEYKSIASEYEKKAKGKIVISNYDFDALHQMYENTQANEGYQALWNFGSAIREYSVFGNYADIKFRCRFDLGFCSDVEDYTTITALADYKTCKSLKDFEADLSRSVKWGSGWMYHLQAVFYSDMLGVDPMNFYFVAVEKENPYATQVFGLSEDAILSARRDLYIAFHKIKTWKETGEDGVVKHDIVRI
jgi:hypothetical protein